MSIRIGNTSDGPVELPLAYLRKKGPSITLRDGRTGAETQLRTNPPPRDLLEQRNAIAPGSGEVIEWVLHESELAHFGRPIDVTARVTVFGTMRSGARDVPFEVTTTLSIRESTPTDEAAFTSPPSVPGEVAIAPIVRRCPASGVMRVWPPAGPEARAKWRQVVPATGAPNRVERCYAIASRDGVAGKKLRFVLQPDGRIQERCDPGAPHVTAELSACLVEVMHGSKPPSKDDGKVTATFQLPPP